jgi:hypothetical protein
VSGPQAAEGPPSDGDASDGDASDGGDSGAGPPGPPVSDSPAAEGPGRYRTARFAWVAVVVILAGVISLVLYALTNPTTTQLADQRTPTAPDVIATLASIPAATFDAVGVASPSVALTPPVVVHGQPLLTVGKKPEVLFVGSEFCPFCAAERWPLIVALSRFGQFSRLYDAQSAPNSVFPDTQSFSFDNATYVSRYLSFVGVELYSDALTARGGFAKLGSLTPAQSALIARYDSTDSSGTTGTAGDTRTAGTMPFVDIANTMVAVTSGFSPAALAHLSQGTIAGDLAHADNPPSPTGQAVVAAANQLSAGLCVATDQRPAAVCATRGVRVAAASLGLG